MKSDASEIRKTIWDVVIKWSQQFDNIISATGVGSFWHKQNDNYSDIDIVVITKNLDYEQFNEYKNNFKQNIALALKSDSEDIYLNTTFGPLKFDNQYKVVIHLMIYTKSQHIEHAIKSPFTTSDWERSNLYAGKSLNSVFATPKLSPSDLINTRRSLNKYMEDLENDSISYIQYQNDENRIFEAKKQKKLTKNAASEYCFHIIKFLCINFLKVYTQKSDFDDSELESLAEDHGLVRLDPILVKSSLSSKLEMFKIKNSNLITRTKDFLLKFETLCFKTKENISQLVVYRHEKTELNDGRFLGRRSDIGIIKKPGKSINVVNKVFSSPLKRCLSTAQALFPTKICIPDSNLIEIDYGLADGLTIKQLSKKWPKIIDDWSVGLDPNFPEGESTSDVKDRILKFLSNSCSGRLTYGIVTHNVVIRCLIGISFNIPQKLFHKIKVKHGFAYEFYLINNEIVSGFELNIKQQIVEII